MGNPFLTEGQENSQVTRKCAFAKSSLEEDSDLNMIHIELEQNKLPAVLDSDASVSLISENFCQNLSLAPKPTDLILEFLDHSRMKTLGTVSLIGYMRSLARYESESIRGQGFSFQISHFVRERLS